MTTEKQSELFGVRMPEKDVNTYVAVFFIGWLLYSLIWSGVCLVAWTWFPANAVIDEYNGIVTRAHSVPYSVFVGAPDIDNSAREALANYCKRRESQCDGSGCKSGKWCSRMTMR